MEYVSSLFQRINIIFAIISPHIIPFDKPIINKVFKYMININ